MYRVTVGSVEIVALTDTGFAFDARRIWPVAGDEIEQYSDYLEPAGEAYMDDNCFLLRADGRTVLVDTGNGPETNGKLLDELRAAGVEPSEVDQVIFTHLHGDHTGWNLDRESGESLFPRAQYLVPKGDWDEQQSRSQPAGSFVRDVAPLERLGNLELFEGERELTPSLVTVPTPGHTPGHSSIAVASNGERAFILGDVFLTPVDVLRPEWSSTFDSDGDQARRTREAVLDRLEQEGSLVGASHLRSPGLGHIVRVEGQRLWRGVTLEG